MRMYSCSLRKMMSFLRSNRPTVSVTNSEACERMSSREENDPVHAFATPTKKVRRIKGVRQFIPHDLDKHERKVNKKKRIAESNKWKRLHGKAISKFRDTKYYSPAQDEPLDFSAEIFNQELSSRESHPVHIKHSFLCEGYRHRLKYGTDIVMTGTVYCAPKSYLNLGHTIKDLSDDILVVHSKYINGKLQHYRKVIIGQWYSIEQQMIHECDYGRGEYSVVVE